MFTTRHRDDNVSLPSLRQALEALTVPELRPAAERVQFHPPTRKAELVNLLTRYLLDPTSLARLLKGMDERTRAAIAEAVHGGGQLQTRAFAAKYGGLPQGRGDGWLTVLFNGQWRIPDDLCAVLRPLVPVPAPAQLVGKDELPPETSDDLDEERTQTVRFTEHAAQADLLAVLRLVEAGSLRCSETTRRPTAGTCKALEAVLTDGDFYVGIPMAAFAWPLLLQAGGLAELAGGRLQLTRAGRQALQEPAPQTLQTLWRRWLERGPIDEFSRVEAIKGQQASGGRNLTSVPPRRHAVAASLVDAPMGRWIDVDAWFTFMQAAGYDFEVVHDPWRLYLGDPQYGSFGYEGYGDWSVVQGRFALCLLFEYAATLGMVDVAYTEPAGARDDYATNWGADDLEALSRYDGLRYFRLTPLGAWCLGAAETYSPGPRSSAPTTVLQVLPNLDVVCTGHPPSAAERLLLERYAAPRSEAVWSLRRDLLLAATARGGGPEELEAFLSERSAQPLPETVRDLLAQVRERVGLLWDRGTVRLVECADANLARQLSGDRRLRGRCTLVGDRHLAVPLGGEEAFAKALWDVGYTLPPETGSPALAPAPTRRR